MSRIKNKVNRNPVSKLKAGFSFLFVFLLIICFYPYEFQSCYFMVFPHEGPTLQVSALIVAVIVNLLVGKLFQIPSQIWVLIGLQMIGFSLCFISQGQPQVILIQITITCLFLTLLSILNQTVGVDGFFKYYNRWIFLMALLGTIAWTMSIYNEFAPLYSVPDLIDTDRLLHNYGLTFSVHDSEKVAMRYSGFFDEPGAMANWGLFALLINKLFVKEKWIEIPLIICLLFTFSMGFYAQLVLYFLFFYLKKENLNHAILILLVVSVVFAGLSTMTENVGSNKTGSVYDKTIGRFTKMFDEGKSKGSVTSVSSRADLTDVAWNEFVEHPLFGTNKNIYIGDNIYEPLATYGIVGTCLVYFPIIWLLLLSYRNKDRDVICAVIIIFAGFIHRPYHRNLLWNLIIYGIITLYLLNRNQQLRSVKIE